MNGDKPEDAKRVMHEDQAAAARSDAAAAQREVALHEAAIRLINSTPGATNLMEVSERRGRRAAELLADEAGLPVDIVRAITGLQ